MRQSREAKAQTHQEIIEKASRLFRERGVEGTSVGDVMQAAEKTHGGFYRHFESKEDLLVAALESAFADMLGSMRKGFATIPRADTLARLTDYYLSPEMIEDVAGGCPIAALSGDVMRSSAAVRDVFGKGAGRVIATIAEAIDGPEDVRLRCAAQTFSMLVGALVIARASDPETAELVVSAVRSAWQADDPGLQPVSQS
ncbi:MAG: TetR/AcrR family transcriptional regulator [Geminicoccaceae bacterium]